MEINRSLSRYEIALLASGYKRIGGEKIFVTVFTKADSLRIKNNPLLGKLAGWKKERRRKKKKKKLQSASYQRETVSAVGVIIIALAGLGTRATVCVIYGN